tara:strand:- start:5649 stop:6113 length:465 start_codon:yes stop_codon:yes gene_type:complete
MDIKDYGKCPNQKEMIAYIDLFESNLDSWKRKKIITQDIDYVLNFSAKIFKILRRERVASFSSHHKIIDSSLAYFCWPNDLVLDTLGPIGFADDTFLLCFVFLNIFKLSGKVSDTFNFIVDKCNLIVDNSSSYLGFGIKKQLETYVLQSLGEQE